MNVLLKVQLLLTTILSLILLQPLFQGTNATPTGNKILLNVDISAKPGYYIRNFPSTEFPRGIYYSARVGNRCQHAIGNVFDGPELIIPGDPNSITRSVLVVPREDGTKYVKVLTKYAGGPTRPVVNVLEFLRFPTNLHYVQIQRVHLDLDILDFNHNQMINAELLVNWQKHDEDVANGRAPMGIPENLETIPMKFTVQEDMQDHFTIGVVKYNGRIVESRTDGLMSRQVTWEGGVRRPRIIILSRYVDNTEIKGRYEFSGTSGWSISHSNKKYLNLFL
ncbi:signal peptide-containing protein [Theileria equi strain WA]|uniref:Signal peptide-containing protein n=1 Tax=Theileria equi strain WA TaxID=1537102 RepID=L0AYP3_THEEQ|nr:signal peptide-containing protein [Theileria equi strain WA]AFZ80685.1 signal peptide-containing protein [Theileria equi strain WA]|eukprot:XP_004830351.1 signal peptide-containing protein [Theileria equi strain WA]